MMARSNYYLSTEAEKAFSNYIELRRCTSPGFANARSVRNALERARLRHAHRLVTNLDHNWNRNDLMRIEPEDVVIRE